MKKMVVNIVLVFILSIIFVSCDSEQSAGAEGYSYITVKINPQVDFVANDDGIVEAAIGINEDAELLLSDVDLSGKRLEDAVEEFVNLAEEAGYIDAEKDDNEVSIEVVTDEGQEKEDGIRESLKNRINKFFANNGIFGNVRQETLDKYLLVAEELAIKTNGVSMGRLKTIIAAFEIFPELDAEDLEQLSTGEIIKLISEKSKKGVLAAQLRAEFKQQKKNMRENKYSRLEELKNQIKNQNSDEQEEGKDNTLTEQYIKELKNLREQYKKELEEIKERYLSESRQIRERLKAEKQNIIRERNNSIVFDNDNANTGNKQ